MSTTSTAATPTRFQRRRVAGWRKPAGSFVVTRPSRFSNPWRVSEMPDGWEVRHVRTGAVGCVHAERVDAHRCAVALFTNDLHDGRLPVSVEDVRRELAGRDLGCSCPLDLPCHADVLLAVAAEESAATDGESPHHRSGQGSEGNNSRP